MQKQIGKRKYLEGGANDQSKHLSVKPRGGYDYTSGLLLKTCIKEIIFCYPNFKSFKAFRYSVELL